MQCLSFPGTPCAVHMPVYRQFCTRNVGINQNPGHSKSIVDRAVYAATAAPGFIPLTDFHSMTAAPKTVKHAIATEI